LKLIKNLSFSLGKDEDSGRKTIIAPSTFDENCKKLMGFMANERSHGQRQLQPFPGATYFDRHYSITDYFLT